MLSSIAALPRSVRSSIGSDDLLVCLVNVESPERRYTLILDLEWVSLAVDADVHSSELTDGLPLPRAAMRAVINDWSFDEPSSEPAVRWSQDGIPHVGFPMTHDVE